MSSSGALSSRWLVALLLIASLVGFSPARAEDPKPKDPAAEKKEDKKPDEKKPDEEKKPEDKKPEDKKPEDKKPEDKKPDEPELPKEPLVDHPLTVEVPESLKALFAGGIPDGVKQLKEMQEHVRKLTEKLQPCVVGIQIGPAQGSGVIISKDGYVLTAAHVAGKPGRDATLIFPDGKRVKAKTLGTNHGIDSGMLKITDKGEWPHVEMALSREAKQGQWCLAIGHPGGYMPDRKPVLRVGRILAARKSVIVTDCTLVGGDSGGPLFDMAGKVIGIHSRIGGAITANMHVPVDTFRETWVRLVKGEDWSGEVMGSGPYLGVSGDPESTDAKVTSLQPDSPASKAGIKEGDVITKFDGKEVRNFQALAILVRGKKPGDKVKVEFKRGDEMKSVDVTIGDKGVPE